MKPLIAHPTVAVLPQAYDSLKSKENRNVELRAYHLGCNSVHPLRFIFWIGVLCLEELKDFGPRTVAHASHEEAFL
jgi:hypothetical protein